MGNPETLADLARLLGAVDGKPVSRRTAGRYLERAMRKDPDIYVWRGKHGTPLFPPGMLDRTMEALKWRSLSADAAQSGTRAAPSGSGARSSRSQSSAQDAVAALTQKLLPQPRKPASGKNALKVMPGGRAG